MNLELLPDRYAVCRLAPDAPLPDCSGFVSITRTADELSVVCREEEAPYGAPRESEWRILKVRGPLDFALTGILASLAQPLADAGVSIFAISTFDTDYVMVKEYSLAAAVRALEAAGHAVAR